MISRVHVFSAIILLVIFVFWINMFYLTYITSINFLYTDVMASVRIGEIIWYFTYENHYIPGNIYLHGFSFTMNSNAYNGF